MANILGITSFYHDSSCCLLVDGEVKAYVEEERFNREKHSAKFPINAISYCLSSQNLSLEDIDYVGYYLTPLGYLNFSFQQFLRGLPQSINLLKKGATVYPISGRILNLLTIKRQIIKNIGQKNNRYKFKVCCFPHYLSHAASAFYPSGFENAAIIVIDAAGDGISQSISLGKGNSIQLIHKSNLPHTIGIVYSAVTKFLGFRSYDEFKVMGLSSYGEPTEIKKMEEHLFHFNEENGTFKINKSIFSLMKYGLNQEFTPKLEQLFGPARKKTDPLSEYHCNLAASLQQVLERFMIGYCRFAKKKTNQDYLVLAGGVIQNCLMNQAVIESGIFKKAFVQPLASDMGCCLGTASLINHQILHQPRKYITETLYTGPAYNIDQHKNVLKKYGLKFFQPSDLYAQIAAALFEKKIVGFFNGAMEVGPRALGNRSILADPRSLSMKDTLNARIKHREPFRPFGPCIKAEKADEYFNLATDNKYYRYMIITATATEKGKQNMPAVVHNDGSSRIQIVRKEDNEPLWQILDEFEKLTGVPCLINTSFNDNEPIVCSPEDAIKCFLKTKMDVLVLDKLLIFSSL